MSGNITSLEALISNKREDQHTGAPYHNVDHDEYPLNQHIYGITGQYLNRHERINGYNIKREVLDAFVKEWQFELVHSYAWYTAESSCGESRKYVKTLTNGNPNAPKVAIGLAVSPYKVIPKKSRDKDEWDEADENSISICASNISDDGWELFRADLIKLLRKQTVKENNISLIVQTRHGYDTQTFDLPKQKLDLDYNYGSSFLPVHDKILKTLNQKKGKGLVLLHGEPGCGKTFYLKYLASQIKTKKVMFVPPYMVDFITSPEMTPFLIENSDSILFIEDAERVITDRDMNSANGVSNILNLTDGILGDILNIQIVATFNMDRAKIDKALLRKGRLIAEHEFGKLGVDESNKLLKHLGKNAVTDKPLTLTQIYNIEETEYKVEDKTSKIGFGR
jgi:energy-coupling factor transporter ATP-binding protein EcfA2